MMICVVKKEIFNVFRDFPFFLLCAVLCFLVFMINSKSKRKRVDWRNMPAGKVNDLCKVLMCRKSILKIDVPNKNIVLLQIFCAYAHLFRKEGMYVLVHHFNPVISVYKAETIEAVLAGSKHLRKGVEFHFIKRYMKDGLIASPDLDKWRCVRKLLLPAFRFLDRFIFLVNGKADVLTEQIATAMKSKEFVDIVPLIEICTLDIFCENGLGTKVEEDDLRSYTHVMKKYKHYSIQRIWNPLHWMDVTYAKTKEGKDAECCAQFLDRFNRKIVIEKKQKKLSQRKCNLKNTSENNNHQISSEILGRNGKIITILDILLDFHLENKNFTVENVCEEVNNFMLAGSDTIPINACWALYLLGLHPEIQQKVHKELEQVCHDVAVKITQEDIKKLEYLECVMKEARRLFPPIPFIGRILEEDTVIGSFTIPKGTNCLINIFMLHRDPAVFLNPDVFDPERFLNPRKRHPYAYIPFSIGPRNCLGRKYGELEAIILVACILRRFKVKSVLPIDKLFINMDITLHSATGLPMIFLDR